MWTFPHYTPGKLPDWQALEHRFSWFADMKNVPQDPEWHAEGDVYVHTKMVCEALLQLPNSKHSASRSSISCLPPPCCTT